MRFPGRNRHVHRLWKPFLVLRQGLRVAVVMACGIVPAVFLPAALHVPAAAVEVEADVPLAMASFRHIDASLARARPAPPDQLRFLVSDDFPPFSFRNRDGALSGFSVAVAQAICRQERLRCRFIVRPFDRLVTELHAGHGDVVISGLRPTPRAWRELSFTRPLLFALGRFAIARNAAMKRADYATLAGRRIAVVKGSLHAAWLKARLGGVRMVLEPDFGAAVTALRLGKVDAVFADGLRLAFWTRGSDSRGCCRLLPGNIVSRLFAYNHLVFALRPQASGLRDFLDRALDRLQRDGQLRLLTRQFLPFARVAATKDASGTEKKR